ncbi:MAG: exodeoxyribonuclease I [Methylococcales bacterium]|nr:exodeoxyribonuclease I [Methylococcales bacterium]
MTDSTFFWHDYETFGTDPQRDRVCQFAGIRTDQNLEIIGEPVMAYCRPTDDYLPHPEACLITGITPQIAAASGVNEAGFAALVHAQLAQPNTCALGYNSLRFDDEVSRNLLYRNFYDPYGREWQNGNSRWDLIDVARATRALRPEGVNWPLNADGVASFRLEELTQANGIAHQSAHDALADVYATIAIARLIRQRQPRLYHYLFEHRGKAAVQKLLQLGSFTPLAHVSGRFPARNNCLAIVLPLCEHPGKSNEVVVYDLSVSPEPLLDLTAAEIRQRVFTATDALPAGVDRIPLKTIHINKCPVLAPVSVIGPADAERLAIDQGICMANLQKLKAATGLNAKLAEVFTSEYGTEISDPDLMIYSGGFFSNHDKTLMAKIRNASPGQLAKFRGDFQDRRLPEMLFRYRARNFPDSLSAEESALWRAFRHGRLHADNHDGSLNLASYQQKIQSLRTEPGGKPEILDQLEAWARLLQANCMEPA